MYNMGRPKGSTNVTKTKASSKNIKTVNTIEETEFSIVPDSSGTLAMFEDKVPKQHSGRVNHFITWFYTDISEIVPVLEKAKQLTTKGTYQTEKCPSTGRPHIHMMLWGHKGIKFRDTALKIPKRNGKNTYKAEPLGDYLNVSNYANKDDESYDGIMRGSWGFPAKIEILERKDFYPFQENLLQIIEGPVNKNKVIWIYDEKGQNGKTEFLRYCFVNHKIPFSYGGKCSDIINLINNSKDHLLQQEKPTIIYNFGRDTDPKTISYKSMEQISDGTISNTKFEAGCFVMNKPHVIVLANCMPLENKLSGGRWLIYTINENKELIFEKNI